MAAIHYPPKRMKRLRENENRTIQMLRDRQERDMKAMREEMHQQFNQIMSVIQENPRLSHVKPEVLAMKIEEQG